MKHRAIICTALCCTLAGTAIGFAAGTAALPAIADLFGDINTDGEINASDASDLLQFCAYQGAGGEGDLKTWLGGAAETTEASAVTETTEAAETNPVSEGEGAYLTNAEIEARPFYVDYDNDGINDGVADGYIFYAVCSGNYDYCTINMTCYDGGDTKGISGDPVRMKGSEVELTSASSLTKIECTAIPTKDGVDGEAVHFTWSNDQKSEAVFNGRIEARDVYVDYDGDGTLELADGKQFYLVGENCTCDFCYVEAVEYFPGDAEGVPFDSMVMTDNELLLCEGSSIGQIVCTVTPVYNGLPGEPVEIISNGTM